MMTIGLVFVWLIVATIAALGFGWLCGIGSDTREHDSRQLDENSQARA